MGGIDPTALIPLCDRGAAWTLGDVGCCRTSEFLQERNALISEQICIQTHGAPAGRSRCNVVLRFFVHADNQGTFIELDVKGK